jgi:hypothetical protein
MAADPMNLTVTILASAATAALVTGFFALLSQRFERAARRKELLFLKSVELAKANREFVAMVAKDMGAGARIHDYVVYAEMYNWLLTELHDSGRLPTDWRKDIKTKFPDI